jgi:outer membrane biosynthesis protein TonB
VSWFRRKTVAPTSAFELLDRLARSEILSPALLEQTRKDVAPRCADARTLAAELVRRRWLTLQQAKLVLHGKHEPLIVKNSTAGPGGNWGLAAAACVALVLVGAGGAYWVLRQPREEPAAKGPRQPLAQNTPEPRPQPKEERTSRRQPDEIRTTEPPAPEPTPREEPKPAPLSEPAAAPVPVQAKPKPEPAKPKDPRRPVPDEAAVAKTLEGIRDLYKEDYKKTKHSEMSAFAERLLGETGNVNDDAPTLYVLFCEARDVASRAADAELAFRAIEELTARFVLDARPLKIAALERTVREAHTPERSLVLADIARGLAEEAASADRYGEAVRLAKLAENAALKSGDRTLTASTTVRRRDIEFLQKTFDDLKPTVAVLKDKPDNPDANLALGRFLCLSKGDWATGLWHLVQSNDEPLKDLARKELAGVGNPQQEAELADAWREQARKERGLARNQMLVHAWTMLQRVLPDLAGVAKLKAEKSVAQIEKELPNEYLPEPPGARFKGRWLVPFANRTLREYSIDNKGNVEYVRESTVNAAGKVVNPREVNRSTKVIKKDTDYLIDFDDGTLERLSTKNGILIVEHYDPKALYPKGRPSIVATCLRKPGG